MSITVRFIVFLIFQIVKSEAVKIGDPCGDDITKCKDVTLLANLKKACPCPIDSAGKATEQPGVPACAGTVKRECKPGSFCSVFSLKKAECPVSCARVVLTEDKCGCSKKAKFKVAVCMEKFDINHKFFEGMYIDTGVCDSEICTGSNQDCYRRSEQKNEVTNKLKDQKFSAEFMNSPAYKQAKKVMIKEEHHVEEIYFLDFFALYVLRFHWGLGGKLDEAPCGPTNLSWHGVECHDDRTVKAIDFSWAKICDDEGNVMVSNIPEAITVFKNIKTFKVQHNQLTGTIPNKIGNLKHLTELNLGSNKLKGSLPDSFYSLTQLKYVNMDNNMFTGTFSRKITQMTCLVAINLSQNDFRGDLPNTMGSLNNLLFFTARETFFQGYCDQQLCESQTTVAVNCNYVADCAHCVNIDCHY